MPTPEPNGTSSPDDEVSRPRENYREDDFVTTYANTVRMARTIYDIRMVFGQIEVADKERLRVKEVVEVLMSPQHAKAMLGVLSQQVEKYEAVFGPLPSASIEEMTD